MHALLALALLASPPPDPLEEAHAQRDPAHVFTVFRQDSAIEDVNKGTVTVFGTRREYRCPGGQLAAETRCDPCTYKTEEWAEHPDDTWVYEVSYANEADHAVAARAARHFGEHFELSPLPGAEKGGTQHLLFAYAGRTKVPPPPVAAKLRVRVGDEERDAASIPYGSTEVTLVAEALKRSAGGALEPMPEANITFAGACASLKPQAPDRVRVGLPPGVERCAVEITANPGGARSTVTVTRELQVEILFEGQAADEVRLEHARDVDLAFRARANDREVAIQPQWKGEHGTFEIHEGGKRARFTLDPGASEGSVLLLDAASGASDTLLVKRPAQVR